MYSTDLENMASEGWPNTRDLSSTMSSGNVSLMADDEEHFCKLILYKEIQNSRVRIWDVFILIPNILFLLFIAVRFNRARLKLRATSSPIFLAFYGLVICNVVISVVRCVVSMTVNAAATVGGKADKVLWVTVRFFLLSTEMSVVIFGLAFGHLDSHSSIRRVLLATSCIALAFTITQGTLELILPDDTFHIPSKDFYVFGHGGMMFWFCSSLVFTMIYLFILMLPWTRLRDRLTLPTRKSFYVYAGTLAALNLVQSVGAGFLNYTQNPVGLCIVDFTAAVYLTLFTPLVYHTFLSEFFGVSQPSIMFSYKAQVDDAMDEDTVSLPHQQSFSSLKTDSDYIYQVHTPSIHMPLYDSQASKSSTSKKRTSLYSLTSAKDSKSSTNIHTSQITLYRPASGLKDFSKHLNTEKDAPDVTNYPSKISDNSRNSQKSFPDLSLPSPTWTVHSLSSGMHESPTGASNSMLPARFDRNFFYKSDMRDYNTNELSEIEKSSLENATATFTPLDKENPNFNSRESFHDDVAFASNFMQKHRKMPPLENTLQSILDNGTDEFKARTVVKGRQFSHVPRNDTETLDEKLIPLIKDTDVEFSEPSLESTTFVSSNNYITTAQQFVPESSFTASDLSERHKNTYKEGQSGGLSDYLLSLRSPKVRKTTEIKNYDSDTYSSQISNSSYTQTESL